MAILLVVIFILMMQFLWVYIDELVGKGLGLKVVLEFMLLGGCTILPLALPLSTLLASMMTLGQMGEHNELKNRYCHIRYVEQSGISSEKSSDKVAISSEKSSDKVAIKEKNSDIILNYLKEHESINNSTARAITGLTAPAVRKIFKKLEAQDLIAGSGENKNRTYSLK